MEPLLLFLLLASCLIAAQVYVLRRMGRNWICPHHTKSSATVGTLVWLPLKVTNSRHNSQHAFDAFSLTHLQHTWMFWAVLSGMMGLLSHCHLAEAPYGVLLIMVFLECTWEVVENSPEVVHLYAKTPGNSHYRGDSVANSLGDVAAATLGGALLVALRPSMTGVLGMILFNELVCMNLIQDSALLSIGTVAVHCLAPIAQKTKAMVGQRETVM